MSTCKRTRARVLRANDTSLHGHSREPLTLLIDGDDDVIVTEDEDDGDDDDDYNDNHGYQDYLFYFNYV